MKNKISISNKTLGLITKKQIKPIPKWEFVIKNFSIWIIFILFLILLFIGISLSSFGIIDGIIIPYFWMTISFIFLISTYFIFNRTKKSYRFYKWQILLSIILLSLFFGILIFKVGFATKIDKNFESKITFYRQVVPLKVSTWSNPEQGYLSGEIISIVNNNIFQIRDFKKKVWDIDFSNSIVKGKIKISIGQQIKIVGNQIDTNIFKASEIRPWLGNNKNMLKENH